MDQSLSDRRSSASQLIVRLAGAVLLLQLLGALLESVGSHVRDREFAAAQTRVSGLLAASASALEVRVRFKLQVQEWKNVLLRGSDPADFARYREAMLGHESALDAALLALGASLASLDEDAAVVTRLRERHLGLGSRYAGALGERQSLEITSALQADRELRGIDRPLDAEFDALATGLGTRAHAAQVSALRELEESITRARWIRGVLLGCSSLLVLMLLLSALRRI